MHGVRMERVIWQVRAFACACAGFAIGGLLGGGGDWNGVIAGTVVPLWVLWTWGAGTAIVAEGYVRSVLMPLAADEEDRVQRGEAALRRWAAVGMALEERHGQVWHQVIQQWREFEEQMPAREARRYGAFAVAAACYLMRYSSRRYEVTAMVPEQWPLSASAWVHGWQGNRRDLVRAAAFVVAELIETGEE